MAPAEQAPFYGRGFYGAVTVSERGQIVIPARARRDLEIGPRDKLLVLGDPEQGLAPMKLDHLMRNLQGSSALLQQIQQVAGASDAAGPAGAPGPAEGAEEGGGSGDGEGGAHGR
ncbi:AbrB/MazE/SpoVT family DNA-binding domain-containing protein [Streptomonospora nanhaiensis]|uniref:AbrB family looped-hinge helix DNA binding protein n=1 Tax=Streptomonospora nanhaiensis TaxID=1323731 RepID=A0A853BKH9_9ACTN|nr:AbrB/MazE/SpoVT family DNA-binding domain-containing protein [Streptomonospora nanhaiensis]MBV2364203.1 AbrB/MazE/SpoVT family DNA-binding domain-containing protein [Streptomonospora nanhaiensis]NYI95157.1 AbrB family looped-hinge helix DNA binding protein [Streptomonospora nanhaiensis]